MTSPTTPRRRQVKIDDITVDPAFQPREIMDADRIIQFAEDLTAGIRFPPLTIYEVSDWDHRLVLVSGFHRHRAAVEADLERFPCEVYQGTYNDALRHAA